MRTAFRLALAGTLALAGLTATSAPANADWYPWPTPPGICTDPNTGFYLAPGSFTVIDGQLMVCNDDNIWVPA